MGGVLGERLLRGQPLLQLPGGALVANPVPAGDEIPAETIRGAIDTALAESARDGIAGKAVTPYLLRRIVEITQGASLRANIALVKNNARLAARIAAALARS